MINQQRFQLPLEQPPTSESWKARFMRWMHEVVLLEKLTSWQGKLLLLGISAIVSLLIWKAGIVGGVLVLVVGIGLPAVYAIVAYPKIGIIITLCLAYSIMWFLRLGVPFPLGTVMDGIELLLMIGFLVRIRDEKSWHLFQNPVSYLVIIWIVYNILQIANPTAESRLAWVYTIRSVAIVMLTYFIFTYYIRTVEFIRLILKIWIGFSTLAAAYAFKQEFFGFFPHEDRWLHSDPNIELLLFIDGHWRIFSIFSDPVAYAYNMVVSSTLCVVLATGNFLSFKKRMLLLFLAGFMLFNMLFSGTRGAFVLPPAAIALYFIMNFSRKVLIIGSIGLIGIVGLIFMPTSNGTILRFQSAFRPNDDPSYKVRKMNQKRIQPYILSHPMGGGLGATGIWGQRFAPHSFLASFPPDSGYVRVAVELGWIGLFIFCTLMFFILRQGIMNYFKIRDPELKAYCLAATLVVFCFNLGNFPQEALVQFPSNIYFYLVTALIIVTQRLDAEKQRTLAHATAAHSK